MPRSKPSLLSVEEAVAAMINMDYIPNGFSVADMTGAFLEVAEVELHNAKIENLPENEIARLNDRYEACAARNTLALMLLEELQKEVNHHESSQITVIPSDSDIARFEFESLSEWAYDRFGISIPTRPKSKKIRWENVTIKIYADWRIGYFIESRRHKIAHFGDMGLMGARKKKPNGVGDLLLDLSLRIKFPKGKRRPKPAEVTAISKLRNSLKKLTNIESDPFTPVNEADGWKPRFRLIDDRRNADDRAKRNAVHVPLDEARDFEDENDAAGEFLRKAVHS